MKKIDTFFLLIISQGIVTLGMGLVFPFYIIFVKEIGADFSHFGFSYALFSLSAAFSHKFIGQMSDVIGRKVFLLINSFGSAFVFLVIPIVTSVSQIYFLQIILGILGAMYKTGEKSLVGDITDFNSRGVRIGEYHGWISIFSALAVVSGGFLIDLLDISLIFYLGSILMFLSGLITLNIRE